jgi:hypothetical protein
MRPIQSKILRGQHPLPATGGQISAMKTHSKLLGLLLPIFFVDSSYAMTRIDGDMGGPLGQYLLKFAAIRDSGESVMIDGSCFSACTLVTAMIPKNRICVTERAKLGFHAGWFETKSGERAVSPTGTQVLYQMYPPMIKDWITSHGGLGPSIIVLEGRELVAIYRHCDRNSRMPGKHSTN